MCLSLKVTPSSPSRSYSWTPWAELNVKRSEDMDQLSSFPKSVLKPKLNSCSCKNWKLHLQDYSSVCDLYYKCQMEYILGLIISCWFVFKLIHYCEIYYCQMNWVQVVYIYCKLKKSHITQLTFIKSQFCWNYCLIKYLP